MFVLWRWHCFLTQKSLSLAFVSESRNLGFASRAMVNNSELFKIHVFTRICSLTIVKEHMNKIVLQ